MPKKTDLYANKFYGRAVESAANTLTFAEIQTNVSIFEKMAWILHRLEYFVAPASMALIDDSPDSITMALTGSENITTLGLDNPAVIDTFTLGMKKFSGVGFQFTNVPIIRDFSELPGGGIVVSPRPLFMAVQGASLASAATVEMRGYFTVQALSADEYLELVDFYRIVR